MSWVFWACFAVLAAVALVAATWPLWRAPKKTAGADRLTVYRRQLAEIEMEAARGLLDEKSAAAAKLEVERRILRVADTDAEQSDRVPKGLIVGAAVAAVAFAAGLYQIIGAPYLPGVPRDNPGAEIVESESGESATMSSLVDRLLSYLNDNPEAMEGWGHLRRATTALNRNADMSQALERAVAARPQNMDLRMLYAESLIVMGEGQIGPAARLALDQAAAIDPTYPALRYYQGLTAMQDDNPVEAERIWKALLAEAPADVPWRDQLTARIAQAEQAQGKAPTGVDGDAAAAIAAMSSEDQEAVIRGMVENLAARMEQTPDDLMGWLRLARAYEVLGQPGEAITALDKAAAAAAKAGDVTASKEIAAERQRLESQQ